MKPVRTSVYLRLFLTLWISLFHATVMAQTTADAIDRKAVIAEIERMIKTPEQEISKFKKHYATSTNIDALYQDPQVSEYPKNVRENGLIFAGHGNTLRFEKPSDILRKISLWFPQELAESRQPQNRHIFGRIFLYGPYTSWGDEAIAFMALWKCAPETAWLHPEVSPFTSQPGRGIRFDGSNAGANSGNNVKACLLHFNTRDQKSDQSPPALLSERIVPLLQNKFANFLATDRCMATGPDDCVMILWMWSSIAPGDARLAQTLQRLAPLVYEVAAPQPKRDSEAYFIQEFRKANFLRSQINSYFANPQQWPDGALAHMFERLIQITENMASAKQSFNGNYAFNEDNQILSPTVLFKEPYISESASQAAFYELLTTSSNDLSCSPIFEQVSATVHREYVLSRSEKNLSTQCANFDAGMNESDNKVTKVDTERLLAIVNKPDNGHIREIILSQLPCHDVPALKSITGLVELCKRGVSEPQQVQKTLQFTGLRLSKSNKYKNATIDSLDPKKEAQTDWLHRVLLDLGATNQKNRDAIVAAIERSPIALDTPQRWKSQFGDDQLLIFDLAYGDGERKWPFNNSRFLIAIHDHVATLVGIPARFNYQYDEGAILAVTDLDKDGSSEVWFTGEFGECDGEGLEAGVDCAITTLHMGEIHGDALTYFTDDRPAKQQAHAMVDQLLAAAEQLDQRLNAQCRAKSIALRKHYDKRGYRNFDVSFVDMNAMTFGRKIGQCYQKKKKIVLTNRLKKPYVPLRVDGVYQSTNHKSGEAALLQFYTDGTVLLNMGTNDQYTSSFFNSQDRAASEKHADARGKYKIKEGMLEFLASGYYAEIVSFVGQLRTQNGKHLLQTMSVTQDSAHISHATFEFIPRAEGSIK